MCIVCVNVRVCLYIYHQPATPHTHNHSKQQQEQQQPSLLAARLPAEAIIPLEETHQLIASLLRYAFVYMYVCMVIVVGIDPPPLTPTTPQTPTS